MKKLFYFLVALPVVAFSQVKKENYDYFVQFNTPQLNKKVDLDQLFTHKAFKEFNKENANIKLNDFISFIDKERAISIHGNFTDSIPYYQVTIPLAQVEKFEQFLQNRTQKKGDSIQKHATYAMVTSRSGFTMAWDSKNLVVFELLNIPNYNTNPYSYQYDDYNDDYYEEEEEVVEVEIEEYDEDTPTIREGEILPPPPTEEEIGNLAEVEPYDEDWESEEVVVEDDEYDDDFYQDYRKEGEQTQEEKIAKQEALVAQMFEKSFVAPTSAKVNAKADISSWIDYQSVYSQVSSLYSLFSTFTPKANVPSDYAIKGMGADLYFENGKARMEQTVEYTEALAKIMSKIVRRKPNKKAFNHFPKNEPLAYLSYHINTAEALKNYPKIAEQMLSSLPVEKQDVDIMMDLITTLIDEEATATLFDGDFTLFFHDMEQYEYSYTSIEYDEDYQETEVEKTITKNKPVFSMIITSSHPTMSEKLINLGVRKHALTPENGHYTFTDKELGEVAILRDGAVLVFTNGLEYLGDNAPSAFAKKVKKNVSSNYCFGNFDINRFVKRYLMNEDFGKDTATILKISDQVKNFQVSASKKIKHNKMKLEAELNFTSQDQNIIIQTLDLIDYLK
ncbi:hypothetical protein DI487_07535 [Flavobacterium sediminis]|uniref:DUF4836 domain-containing protein n=1 Tax=Flavobacterium sediminis TaxID=2201181 RepID=A0A2U8QUG2_9FLAO|nr:hypothetical protein [Flavobacterium sediminis]AWM13729.1 hypothetical protein DI487_07535 [Flavobacterium sediminis]